MSDEAQAVSSVAELGSNVVKATQGAGGWFVKILGNIPEDALGLLGGDWLHYRRRLNIEELEAKLEARLASLDRCRLSEPNSAVLMPLLLAARDESNSVLQDIWAALLAGCMTDRGASIRRTFVDIVQKLDPADAVILCCYDRAPKIDYSSGHNYADQFQRQVAWIAATAQQYGISQDGRFVSEQSLTALGLMEDPRGPHPAQADARLTPLARLFLNAVDPDRKLDFTSL